VAPRLLTHLFAIAAVLRSPQCYADGNAHHSGNQERDQEGLSGSAISDKGLRQVDLGE